MDELAQLRDLPPAEARQRLIAVAREKGTAALEALQAALAVPALAEAALDALAEVADQAAWDALERVAAEGPAALRKAARRAQHRLRSRGFSPAVPAAPVASPAVEQARASYFDSVGAQFLRLVRPATLGMVRYASFITGPEGLLECTYTLASRADLAAALGEEDKQFGGELVELDLAYIARRVRQAVARSREGSKPLPRHYAEAARLLEDAAEDVTPAELVATALDTPVTLQEAARLIHHRSLGRWILDPERLAPYAGDWLHLLEYQPARTQEGLPNLGAIQARGQISARIIADLYDAATMRRLAEQLAEQARVFFASGEQDLAGLALRSATELERQPGPDNAFLHVLVEESMELAVRALRAKEEEQARGPWVPAEGTANPLWVPRPAEPEKEEGEQEKPAPRLWLPGQS